MKIFLAFGKNKKMKNEIQTILENLGHEVIVLEDKANKGDTIIEKFEGNSNVDKAVFILSGDDTIKPYKARKAFKTARQNVIFEFGYFVAKLSRKNIIAIVENADVLHLLSDYAISYIKYDQKTIKKKIEKELSVN